MIGDKKTPADYRLRRGTYVSPAEQQAYDPALSDAIGWNCIQRRNFGLLWAHDRGAEVVAVVDDDNIPLDGWGENLLVGRNVDVDFYETDLPAFDPVGATNHRHLWHRGYPLQLLARRDYSRKSRQRLTVDVQADFWNGDPDIDAVCRMEHAPECRFDADCFPLAANRMSPFNSQNTFLTRGCLRDYFLFPHVGRMDDIWASYYLQAKGAASSTTAPVSIKSAILTTWSATCARNIWATKIICNWCRIWPAIRNRSWRIFQAARCGPSSFIGGTSTMRKMLVTGAAGFVGRHLVRRLLEAGDEVHAVDCLAADTGGIDPRAAGRCLTHATSRVFTIIAKTAAIGSPASATPISITLFTWRPWWAAD